MAKKANDTKVSLSKKRNSSACITLKLPNFLTLPGYDTESQAFEFANATWQFRFFPKEKKRFKSFSVNMIRVTSEFPHHKIICKSTLLNCEDKEYDSEIDVYEIDHDSEIYYLTGFDNGRPSYDRRDKLNLVIILVHDTSTEKDAYQISNTTDRDVDVLSQDFKSLFISGKKQDLILRVADKEFRVHKAILAARSEVFEAMLNHDMKEKEKGVIDVSDCDPEAMEQFLFYLYSGEVKTLSSDNVLGLYYVADKYNMALLKGKCAKFIKRSLSPSIICGVIQLALNHSDTDLLEFATEFFVNHTSEIFDTVEWMSFMKSNTIAANELLVKASKKWRCTI